MALIVRPRVLHVTTNLSHSTLHLVTANERTGPESDWKHSKKQNCSYDSYNFQHYACLCCRFSLVILVKGSENS